MEEDQKNIQESIKEEEAEETKTSRGSVFEGIYDQLPDISVHSLDRFIVICVIALVGVIVVGVLKAHHIIP